MADRSSSAAAQALFDDAKKLMAAGNFEAACPKLEESQQIEPGGGTVLLLARCHARAGKTASAWAEYQDGLRIALRDNRKDRERVARAEAGLLEPRLTKLTIVAPPAPPPGFKVIRDGHEVGAGQWSLEVALDPGPHEVSASAPGYTTYRTTVEMPHEGATVTVTLPPLAKDRAAAPAPAPPANIAAPIAVEKVTPSESTGNGRRVVAGVVATAGLALFAGGGYFLVRAKSLDSQSHDPKYCAGNRCTPDGVELRDDALRQARTATLLLGVGAAAAAGAIVIWMTAPSGEQAGIAWGVSPGQIVVRGAF